MVGGDESCLFERARPQKRGWNMRKYDVFLVQRRECQSFFQVFVDFPSALFNASVQYLNEQHLVAFCAWSASFSKKGVVCPFWAGDFVLCNNKLRSTILPVLKGPRIVSPSNKDISYHN